MIFPAGKISISLQLQDIHKKKKGKSFRKALSVFVKGKKGCILIIPDFTAFPFSLRKLYKNLNTAILQIKIT